MGYATVFVFVTSPLANTLDISCQLWILLEDGCRPHTDLVTGAFASGAGWKLNAPFVSSTNVVLPTLPLLSTDIGLYMEFESLVLNGRVVVWKPGADP